MNSMDKITKFAQSNAHIQESINIIRKSFTTYNVEETCVSFNGGKDCTAVLHLVHSVASNLHLNNNVHNIKAFYAQLPNHFEEESSFVTETVKRYNLKLLQYSTNSLKESLLSLRSDDSAIQAVFIGTRNDDLKEGTRLEAFAPTDAGWPKFMRINPILNWSYDQVWAFIKEMELPYCDLYNQGYSSLGTKSDTIKNPSLLKYNSSGEPYYLPAWYLVKPDDERMSRSSSLDISNKNQSG